MVIGMECLEYALQMAPIPLNTLTNAELACVRVIENIIFTIETLEKDTRIHKSSAMAIKHQYGNKGYINGTMHKLACKAVACTYVYVDVEQCSVGDEQLIILSESILCSSLYSERQLYNLLHLESSLSQHHEWALNRITVYDLMQSHGLEYVKQQLNTFAISNMESIQARALFTLQSDN